MTGRRTECSDRMAGRQRAGAAVVCRRTRTGRRLARPFGVEDRRSAESLGRLTLRSGALRFGLEDRQTVERVGLLVGGHALSRLLSRSVIPTQAAECGRCRRLRGPESRRGDEAGAFFVTCSDFASRLPNRFQIQRGSRRNSEGGSCCGRLACIGRLACRVQLAGSRRQERFRARRRRQATGHREIRTAGNCGLQGLEPRTRRFLHRRGRAGQQRQRRSGPSREVHQRTFVGRLVFRSLRQTGQSSGPDDGRRFVGGATRRGHVGSGGRFFRGRPRGR